MGVGGKTKNIVSGHKQKKFLVSDVFELTQSKSKINAVDAKFDLTGYNYVVRTAQNNGIKGKISGDPKLLNEAKTLSFGQDTATVFYQSEPYFTGDKIKVLKLKGHELTPKIAQYLLAVIRKSFKSFSWGITSFNEKVLKKVSLQLPVKGNGIDFQFMEGQISLLEESIFQESQEKQKRIEESYLKVSGLKTKALNEAENLVLEALKNLANKQNRAYKLIDLFTSQTGDVDLQQRDVNGQGEFFINSGKQNFGIRGKTDRQARIFEPNTITIDLWGLAYYRPFKYKLATHNDVFSLSGKIIKNEKVGLYLVASLRFLRKIFQFFHKATWNKVNNFELRLPVKNDGTIDFEFMETAINAVTKEYLHEIEIEHQRTLEAYKKAMS